MDLALDPGLDCQDVEIQRALDYWRAIRGLRTAPNVEDLDVLQIPRSVLPLISLVDIEYDPEPRFRWRLTSSILPTSGP